MQILIIQFPWVSLFTFFGRQSLEMNGSGFKRQDTQHEGIELQLEVYCV